MAYIGNIPADKYQTLQKQSFTTSATDTYTLSYAVTNPQDLALFINNVRQNPNDAYTVSGTTLTLSSAITGSDTMYAVFLGRAVETVAPALSSVTNDMLAGSIANSKLANSSITLNGSAVSLGGSATVGGTNTPYFHAYRDTNQSISVNTWTKLQLNSELFDTNNYFDNITNYRFTPQIAGKYYIYGSVNNGASMQSHYTGIYKNGSKYVETQADASAGSILNVSAIIDFNGSTDYVELYTYYQSGTPSVAHSIRRTFLGGFKIIE